MKNISILSSLFFAFFFLSVACVEKDDGSRALSERKVSFLISDVSSRAPETRGTPAYTENVATLYGSFDANVFGADDIPSSTFSYNSSTGKWSYMYDFNPWNVADPIHYWMCMPSGITSAGVQNLSYDGSGISFNFTTPSTAVNQKDILFATKVITRNDHDANRNNVLFYHALTGVKFALGDTSGNTKISRIELSGLMGSGSCVVTPTENVNSAGCVMWSDTRILRDNNNVEVPFVQTFSNSDIVNFSSSDGNHFANSFYAAAASNNVNDATASKTFWFIPQQLSSTVILTVSFTVNGVASVQSVSLGDKAKKDGVFPVWDAGQLRTYILTPHASDLVITENVHSTGNVHAYGFETL